MILLGRLRGGLRRLYLRLRQWYPVWFYWVNRRARQQYRVQYIMPGTVEQKILDQLSQDGLAISNLEELFPGENWLELLQDLVRQKRETAKPQDSKPFLLQLWDNKAGALDFSNPFLKFALSERLLGIVNAYLKLISRFYFFEGSITLPVGPSTDPRASQRWHRDPEDTQMCKVFVYLNDVDETAGPFHYLLGSHHGGRYGRLFPQRPPAGSYPPAGAVEAAVNPADIRVCTGRAGTVIFCDTAGLHRGGYATGRERLMLTAGYSSPKSLWPSRLVVPPAFDRSTLNPLANQVLN